MTYPEALRYLAALINYERDSAYNYKGSLKLGRIRDCLAAVGNPHRGLKFIHVAGTKGKGSTCAFTAYILREAGYKVGLYTSPHLSDFRERIRVLSPRGGSDQGQEAEGDFSGMIPEDDLARLLARITPAIERCNANATYGPLTFFEVYTVLALLYFQEARVDFAVLESGLGGRLDATNAVEALAAALTPISYEHVQILGNTLREIAREKSGIIKNKGLTVISAPQDEEVREVIRVRCRHAGARLYEVGRDICWQKTKSGFSIKGMRGAYENLKIGLCGAHQLVNAAVSLGIIEALAPSGVKVDLATIRKGLYNTRWPARCEVISDSPKIILDGAQNIASARAIKETIRECFSYQRLILVLGISSDKDVKGVCNELKDLADEIILTRADNPRAVVPDDLFGYFRGKRVYRTKSVTEARELVYRLADKDSLALVCGSLFVAGEFRDAKI